MASALPTNFNFRVGLKASLGFALQLRVKQPRIEWQTIYVQQ